MGANCSSGHSGHFKDISDIPQLKIAVVGDSESGKSSILQRFLKNQFSPLYIPTKKAIIESRVLKINVPGHTVVSLEFWDIPGRDDVDLYQTYFRNLDAAIVVVDITDSSSIEMAHVWKQIIMNNAKVVGRIPPQSKGDDFTEELEPVNKDSFPIIIMGNKFDIVEQKLHALKLEQMEKNDSNNELTMEDKNRRVWSLGKSPQDLDKPECVRQLESYAKEHTFHGSIMVSARDNNGSVCEALMNIVRHLVMAKYGVTKWKPKDKKKEEKKAKELTYEGLQTIGSEKMDEVFNMADIYVKKAAMLNDYHDQSLDKIKEQCTVYQVVEKDENSLEDCMAGLKSSMEEGADIKVKKDDKFCKLVVSHADEKYKPPKKIRRILKVFHKEYAAVCKAILKECPTIQDNLNTLDNRLEELCSNELRELFTIDAEQTQEINAREITQIVEQNRAKMKHAIHIAGLCQDKVDESKKKIKMAFMWSE